jgi:hypothetical protein
MTKFTRLVTLFLVACIGFLVLGLVATPGAAPAFVGEKKCKKCHIKDHKTWRDTKHAKAFEYLDAEQQKDAECIKCHTTGYGMGGFTSVDATPELLNVQCEQCHGAGGNHIPLMDQLKKDKVDKSEYPADKKIDKTPSGCTQCHNPHKKHAPVDKK